MAIVNGISVSGSARVSDPRASRWRGITAPFVRHPKGFFSPRGTREVIWSSIINILLTPIGTRIMIPDFGSLLPELLFEPNDEILESLGRRYVVDAIGRWEPRVKVSEVNVARDIYNDRQIVIALSYLIVGESTEEQRVLPLSATPLIPAERA